MKKVIIGTMLATSVAFAGSYGSAGCGLGSLVFGDKEGAWQLLASTTNGTSGNQTFGITSGTLNCGKSVFASSNQEVETFAANNIDALALDIAQGGGEALTTLASLMNVKDSAVFSTNVQINFEKIFTHEDISSSEVVQNILNIAS